MTRDDRLVLADEILTFIEQRESEQIAYGIYDVTMTGDEVIANFKPSKEIPDDQRGTKISTALRYLADEALIIRFSDAEDPSAWIFRSRIAETVRLLNWLRQRLPPRSDAQKERISQSKRLVGDVTFHVAPRRVPRREISSSKYLTFLRGSNLGDRCADLLGKVIEESLPKLRQISQFQQDALREILQIIETSPSRNSERGVVVTASTGAGKTYAFFLPVLAKIIIERCLRDKVGVKAICIYPRVALSENQLSDFVEAIFSINKVLQQHHLPALTIGIESGSAVYQSCELSNQSKDGQSRLSRRGWRYDKDFGGYLAPFAYCVGQDGYACGDAPQQIGVRADDPKLLRCPVCGTTYPFIQFARDVMRVAPPDLLVATTESLNRRLVSSEYQYLFGTSEFCAPSVVMLDEIHLQTSTAGTQVALLLRRLLSRIRLGKQERGDPSNLAFVGLSATIANPNEFLSELSGIPSQNIREVTPRPDQLDTVGAERYIFVRAEDSEDTAVISTLIQTAMCVLHTMPQPSDGNAVGRYRSFGFVQSLDIVGRWLYQMQDAEKNRESDKIYRSMSLGSRPIKTVPLYAYRFPPYNRKLFPNLFGAAKPHRCDCENGHPDRTCPYFAAGECWWALSQKGKVLQNPLNIRRKSGADRDKPIEPNDDLIITTSALEVGYDDESLMCVIQYTAPSNVASFVQRKGRGGRKVGTRPIVVTVLSPYKSTDLFLFRNQHLLTDPTFRKLPLNAQNRYLQRIHGFYALIDWLAYQAHLEGTNLSLDEIEEHNLTYVMDLAEKPDVLQTFKEYLRQSFGMSQEALSRVLTETSEGLLMTTFKEGFIHQAAERLEKSSKWVKPRELLRRYLPENLFSDINLPEVQVDYRPDKQSSNKHLRTESISLALGETIPGNVTFRGGNGSVWIPPIPVAGSNRVAISPFYEYEELENKAQTVGMPRRALKLLGVDHRQLRTLQVMRPAEITPKAFSQDYNGSYWYVDPSEPHTVHEVQDSTAQPQNRKQLAHSCSAFPINAITLRAEQDREPRDYIFGGQHRAVTVDPIARALVSKLILYSDEAANQNLLRVQKLILGTQYTLKSREPGFEDLSGILGFCQDEAHQAPVAIGFEMVTEGMRLNLNEDLLETFAPSHVLAQQLHASATLHRFITWLTIDSGAEYFPSLHAAGILLTIADQRIKGHFESIADLRSWFRIDIPAFASEVHRVAQEVHGLSKKNTGAVMKLLSDGHLQMFLDIYEGTLPKRKLFQDYLRDTFYYSLAVALRQVAQEIAGVEALNYVSTWTELCVDYPSPTDSIWLYEIGMGGIGVMRATHDMLRSVPDQLWTELGLKMTRCPTAQEEGLLRLILSQPEEWLISCDAHVANIIKASSTRDRQVALDELLAVVRQQLGLPISPASTKSLLRVFVSEYTQTDDGMGISNWRLYREINQVFLPQCASDLGREPTIPEARALLAQAIQAHLSTDNPMYPELCRLARAYCSELEAGQGESALQRHIRAALENAIERRLLITCRGRCPNCLDDRSGEIESPGMAKFLLNRTLLTEWVSHVRMTSTISISTDGSAPDISKQLRTIFETGSQVAYLRAPASKLGALCSLVSYLTDAGVDTNLGMRYPMIDEVRTVYPDALDEQPLIEMTLRPID